MKVLICTGLYCSKRDGRNSRKPAGGCFPGTRTVFKARIQCYNSRLITWIMK